MDVCVVWMIELLFLVFCVDVIGLVGWLVCCGVEVGVFGLLCVLMMFLGVFVLS